METPLPGSTPEGNFSSDPKPEKESALTKTLRRLGLFSERSKEEADEDEEEETEEKPKKFRRFFKGLFKNVVTPPTDPEAHPPKRFDLETFLGGAHITEESTPDKTSEIVGTEQSELRPEVPVTDAEITPEASSDQTLTNEVTATTENRENPTPNIDILKPDSGPEHVSLTPETTLPRYAFDQSQDRTVFERTAPQPVDKEVVIERGAGMALPVALVGAEYLARKKADRKLDAKYNEKVTKLETENDHNNIVTEQLNNLVRQNREQLDALKRERGIAAPLAETRAGQIAEHPVIQAETQQRAEHPASQTYFEKQPPQTPEQPEGKETYKIMEQVAEAAEQNVPVERVFERSHEVKDDQTGPVGAASIGAIMAARGQGQQLPQQNNTNQQPTDTSSLPVAYDKPAGDMYKQAMMRGFWAGVIIIILGTIAYLLK